MLHLCRRLQLNLRTFSSTTISRGRALVFSKTGNPSDILRSVTFPRLPPPPPHSANELNFEELLLSPVNPADVNVIEGVYPSQPIGVSLSAGSCKESPTPTVYIGGNEGLAEITQVGEGVVELQKHDWVVLAKPQRGAWSSSMNLPVCDVLRVSKSSLQFNEVIGATLTANPPTAYNLLHNYVPLKEGDWVLQNGANSSVGQAVIQVAASMGVRTINFVRNRDDIVNLTTELHNLGATHVLTYDVLADSNTQDLVRGWTGGKHIHLGLNCIGGRETMLMARLLGQDAHLVSYGAMSKQPLTLLTSQFIFKNLKCHGFWQTQWYNEHTREERAELMNRLMALIDSGNLKEPKHEIITIGAHCNDEEATEIARNAIKKATRGMYGRKVLFKIEEPFM